MTDQLTHAPTCPGGTVTTRVLHSITLTRCSECKAQTTTRNDSRRNR